MHVPFAAIGFSTPLWALADSHQISDMAVFGLTGEVDGYIYLGQQTPAFYAKQVVASVLKYGQDLLPPFFGGLMAYDGEANIAFDCPGHQGGQFYSKSPAGQIFFKYFGESVFRNDLCNADVDLGDLLIHEGPAAEAQRYAAQVFGADKTYFVLNGTSTSNKVVTNALLKRGDLVLFDRNNHKSLHQGALVQAGAIPIFLPTSRNPFGMIGAVDWSCLGREISAGADTCQSAGEGSASGTRRSARSASHASNSRPMTARSTTCARCWRRSATFATTFFGTRHGSATTPSIRCSKIIVPCAWIDLGPQMPGLFSTQSVHKQGAGFSQASQIHKRDDHIRGQRRFVEHKRFNESFLMNASTSPFYPLFASLEVNAKVHEGKAGEMLWDRCIGLGIECRKKLREFCRYYEETGRER